MKEMPRYKCHKVVHALKIKRIDPESTGAAIIFPEEEGYSGFDVDMAYMKKHEPRVGGYYVVYEDGYKSFSPSEAFEAGYSRL